MRIAYIAPYIDNETMRGGVGRKISTQMGFWQKRNHEIRLYVLSPDEIQAENCSVFPYGPSASQLIIQPLSRTISRSRAALNLIRSVRNYQPDLVYMRFGRYTYPIHRLYRLAPVILELNTDDINENRHLGLLLFWISRLTRGLVLNNAAGLIAVSHEIAELPTNKMYKKPVRVIANGIDLEHYRLLPPSGNTKPVITIVGSPGMIWHGVDKLICLAKRCPDLKINIVGYQLSDVTTDVPSNVQLHGFLDRAGVRDVLMKTDVACGSLALHRNHMREASPLKVREALAYGIPVLLGYEDTDLSNLESEYILKIPNTEDNVDAYAEKIRSFAYRMVGKRLSRDLIEDRVDQGPKEEARLAFFDEIIKNHEEPRYK
jgi:glycosyltransferase involved in cell wall biosynthesis